MQDFSLNEVASKAKLAAKGAGLSWGMAEEVSVSVLWLVSRGLPAPSMLLNLLRSYSSADGVSSYSPGSSDNARKAKSDILCPISSACAISDKYRSLDAQTQLQLQNVVSPVLMLPLISDLAKRTAKDLLVCIGDKNIIIAGECVYTRNKDVFLIPLSDRVTIQCANKSLLADEQALHSQSNVLASRVEVSPEDWQGLDAYAKKTYAPATKSSRDLGAGAGLTDND